MSGFQRFAVYCAKVLIVVTGILILLALPALVVQMQREQFSWGLLLVGMLPGILAIAGALRMATRFLKSLYRLDGLLKAPSHIMRCIFGQPTKRPMIIASGGQVRATNDTLLKLGGPGSLIVFNDSAVVMERNGRFTRVVEPGQARMADLAPFERVYDTVDVRPTRWEYAVQALSKGGIPVTIEVGVNFQINTGGRPSTRQSPYRALPDAVFTACTSRWMRAPEGGEDDQYFDWARRVIVDDTQEHLRAIVAGYSLDALVGLEAPPEAPGSGPERKAMERSTVEIPPAGTTRGGSATNDAASGPRDALREALEAKLNESARTLGVQINEVRLGAIKVRDDVAQQWIDFWQTTLQSRAIVKTQEGLAQRESLREHAKTQAQVDMMTSVAQAFNDAVTEDHQIPPRLLYMRLVQVLSQSTVDPSMRVYMPKEAINTMDRLRALIDDTVNGWDKEQGG